MTEREADALLAMIPTTTRAWSPGLRDLLLTLPADPEARTEAIIGSLAHCQTSTGAYLWRKWEEIESEAADAA